MNKLEWHRPRIVTVEWTGPFRTFKLFTLLDGRTIIVPNTPTVVNSTDVQRKARKAEQGRLATRACRARKKQRNPVTKRLDPVSIFNPGLPVSIYQDLDELIMKKLEDNQRDVNAKPITSVEEAMTLVIEEIVKAEASKKGSRR